MSNLERDLLRVEAKKVYKANIKKVPRGKRMSFAEFFKKYRESKKAEIVVPKPEEQKDFDFGDMVNVNKIEEPKKE